MRIRVTGWTLEVTLLCGCASAAAELGSIA
jgi:hypothetical protein